MQRVRWASKTTGYSNVYAKILAVVVLLMNVSLVIGFGFWILECLNCKILIGVFLIKYLVDYLLLFKSNKYFRNSKFFLPIASSLIYPLFSSCVGIYSLFGGFTWKGRSFKK